MKVTGGCFDLSHCLERLVGMGWVLALIASLVMLPTDPRLTVGGFTLLAVYLGLRSREGRSAS